LGYDTNLIGYTQILEKMYSNILYSKNKKISIDEIDFLGLNIIDQIDNPFEFKVYFQPEDLCVKSDKDHKVIQSAFEKNMVKCRCYVKSSLMSRDYIVLKNKSEDNMRYLYENLCKSNIYLKYDFYKFPMLFPFKDLITNKTILLHMIGIKSDGLSGNIINLEWLLRDVFDEECNKYNYNDKYFLNYINDTKILEFNTLLQIIKLYWKNKINEGVVHLWLMAIDYFSNGRKKYKLYLKGNNYLNMSDVYISLTIFFEKNPNIVNAVKKFLSYHTELQLYGLALCIDSTGKKSVNYYFVSTEAN